MSTAALVPYIVVRANNLPLAALAPLTRSAPVEALAAALAAARAALATLGGPACDILFALAASEPADYRRLIDAKRRIFNGAPLADTLARHRALLAAHPGLQPWLALADAVLHDEQALAAHFAAALGQARDHAQGLAQTPVFLQAMAMTRNQVYQSARAYAGCARFDDKKALNDEETIYRYLTRAIVKVSPFSTFSSVGFAPLSPQQPAGASLLAGRTLTSRFSLDRAAFLKMFEQFMLRHAGHWQFRPSRNRVARDGVDQYYLFMDKPAFYAYRTTFVKSRASLRALFPEADGDAGWRHWDEIAARLPATADPAGLLAKWVAAGLLDFSPRLDDEDADLLGQFAAVVRTVAAADASGTAAAVLEPLAAMQASMTALQTDRDDGAAPDPAQVSAHVSALHAGMEALSGALGVPLVKRAGLVYHDSGIPDLAAAAEGEIGGFAGQIQEFLGHYLGNNFYSGIGDAPLAALRTLMDGRGSIGVFDFYELAQQALGGQALPADAATASAVDVPGQARAMLRMYDEIWARRGEDEIVLAPVEQGAAAPRAAFAAYGHLWHGRFVLNNVDSGYLRCYSRFFTFTRDAGVLAACRAAYHGKLDDAADFYDTFGFNTACRPRICARRIWLDLPRPGAAGARARPGDLALADLAVTWPVDAAYPVLVDRASGSPLLLRQSGLFTRELYPKLLELLLRFGMATAPCYFAFRFGLHKTIVDRGADGVVVIPRVRYRDIVLSRRQWWIPHALLPQRAPQEALFDYFLRLDAWRRATGLPQRVFVRRHSSAKVLDRDTSNGKKPLFIDFSAPIMVRMIGRIFNTGFDQLSVEEMIPDEQDQRAQHDGRSYAHEILFEVGTRALF